MNRNSKASHGFIYLFGLQGTDFYKIGFTRSLKQRLSNVNTHSPSLVDLVDSVRVSHCRRAESLVHARMAKYRTKAEWFKLPDLDAWRDAVRILGEANLVEPEPTRGRPLERVHIPVTSGPSELATILGVSRQRAWQILKQQKVKANKKLLKDLDKLG